MPAVAITLTAFLELVKMLNYIERVNWNYCKLNLWIRGNFLSLALLNEFGHLLAKTSHASGLLTCRSTSWVQQGVLVQKSPQEISVVQGLAWTRATSTVHVFGSFWLILTRVSKEKYPERIDLIISCLRKCFFYQFFQVIQWILEKNKHRT